MEISESRIGSGGGEGRIYLPANPRLRQSLRAVHSLFIELATIHHLSMSNDRERRIWYLLDELPALPPIKGLPELANTGRSKGASLIVGTQSFAQLDQSYGAEGRRALHNACATSVVFSVADKNTAAELSDHLGKAEVEQSRQNLSIGFLDTKDSVTAMTQKSMESLYLPDQIKDLPILTAVVKVLGFPAAQTQLKPVDYRRVAPEFVADPRMSLETYLSEYQEWVRAVEEVAKAGAAGGGAGNTVLEVAAPPAIQTQASPVVVEQGADLAAIADDF
ncbi:type IV secretion system DNA-binding domain-containing protein [Geobacter anodireducens]